MLKIDKSENQAGSCTHLNFGSVRSFEGKTPVLSGTVLQAAAITHVSILAVCLKQCSCFLFFVAYSTTGLFPLKN